MKIPTLPVVVFASLCVACPVHAQEQPGPAASPAAATERNPEEVVARVNGQEIKRKELDAAVRGLDGQLALRGRAIQPEQMAQFEYDVLEELIGRVLLLQEGSAHPPADIEARVRSQLEQTRAQLGGEEGFARTLRETGITAEEYGRRVHENIVIRDTVDRLVEREVKVDPEEVKKFYEDNPEQFRHPELVRASHILVRVPPDSSGEVRSQKLAQIEAARALIKGGESFAEVARKVSEDPGSAANGGDLGFFRRGVMVPEFEMAAFSLGTNELSDIITTRFGYHIVMVTDRRPPQTVPLEQVRADIEEFLRLRKGSAVVRKHVQELRKAANVQILLPEPARPAPPFVETPPAEAPAP